MEYVLVTGAYGGMGKAMVDTLLDKGFFVIALDKKITNENKERLLSLEVDVTQEEKIKWAFEKVKEITNTLTAIIHFTGIYMLDSLVEIKTDSLKKIFDINFFGPVLINKAFISMLKKGSKIIMITSELATLDPLPFTGIYAITKSSLDKYAYSLRMELQLLGISVSVLRAGAVKTNMLNASTNALDDFCTNTKIYSCNAKRFRNIVDSVEAKSVEPNKISKLVMKIMYKKNPSFSYKINANFLLILLNMLPHKLQFWVIKQVLKTKKEK